MGRKSLKIRCANEIVKMPGSLIRRCNQVAIGIFLEETAGHDLTPSQYGALTLIANEPGMDQTRLADRSALDRTSVTKCVERLERRAAIHREIDPEDRRVRRLFPTPQGLALFDAVDGAVARAQARLLEPLGKERQGLFLEMLSDIASANNALSRVPISE